jgi:F420H(2)-dependent biliverdin reductase
MNAASTEASPHSRNDPENRTDAVPGPGPELARLWQRLAEAEACWFATVRPDGRAHNAPIWHVCHAQEIYVVTQPGSVRARNVAHNPSVSIALPDPKDVLIVEGQARFAPEAGAALRPLFREKYGWDIGHETSYTTILAVTPRKMMAWGGTAGGFRHTFQSNSRAQSNTKTPNAGETV